MTRRHGDTECALAWLINARRRDLHLSVSDLALRCDLSLGTIKNVEQGRPGPLTERTLAELAKALDLPVERLRRAAVAESFVEGATL